MKLKKWVVFPFVVFAIILVSCQGGEQTDKKQIEAKGHSDEKVTPIQHNAKVEGNATVQSVAIDKKLLHGSWLDDSEAALHFTLNRDGSAKSDNMATLLYKKWQLKGNQVTFTIESIGNHTSSTDDEIYTIVQIDGRMMELKDSQGKSQKYTRKHPSINIKPNQKITSPLKIIVNSRAVWFASEGELGNIQIVDNQGNVLNEKDDYGILGCDEDNWMTDKPVNFSTILKFDPKGAKEGKIIVYSDPGEGDGEEAGVMYSFEIPVRF